MRDCHRFALQVGIVGNAVNVLISREELEGLLAWMHLLGQMCIHDAELATKLGSGAFECFLVQSAR